MATVVEIRKHEQHECVLEWNESNCLDEFRALVRRPPLRSVVVDIHPGAAALLLREANVKNRPLSKTYVATLTEMYDKSVDGVTGDTIKFGRSGRLIDGQHRLWMASRGKTAFRTHVVFGINDEAFDIIDQGRKRSAGDVLAVDLIPNAVQTASAVRWVYAMTTGDRTDTTRKDMVARHSPRGIRRLIQSDLALLPRYAVHGQRVFRAFGFPAGMVQALVFLVAQHDHKMAERFVEDWISGSRDGPNKTFDVLQQRVQTIKHQNNGRISHMMRGAFIVTAFNYWRHNEIAPSRAFSWHKGLAFPKLSLPPRKTTR